MYYWAAIYEFGVILKAANWKKWFEAVMPKLVRAKTSPAGPILAGQSGPRPIMVSQKCSGWGTTFGDQSLAVLIIGPAGLSFSPDQF